SPETPVDLESATTARDTLRAAPQEESSANRRKAALTFVIAVVVGMVFSGVVASAILARHRAASVPSEPSAERAAPTALPPLEVTPVVTPPSTAASNAEPAASAPPPAIEAASASAPARKAPVAETAKGPPVATSTPATKQ